MREALDYIVEQIISTYQGMINAEQEAQIRENRKAGEAEKSRLEEEKRNSETEKNISAGKLRNDGNFYLYGGIALMVAGSAVGITVACFSAGEYDAGWKNKKDPAMLASGLVIVAGSIAGGTALLVKGLKMKKEAEYLELNNVSVLPTNDGFYASLGFSF